MVFFLSNMLPGDCSRGITKKTFAQIDAMNKIGHEVKYYTGYTSNGAAVFNKKGEIIYSKRFPTKNALINRVFRNKTLKTMAFEYLSQSNERFDDMYFRYLFFDKETKRLYEESKKHSDNLILEMHSYPNYNKGQYFLYPVFVIDRFYRNACIKFIDKIVTISSHDYIFGKKTIKIDNGVDLDNIRIQKKKTHNGVRIISVSYEWLAHGYNRLIKGLYEYYKKETNPENVEVWFVGTMMKSTSKLINELHMSDKIKFLGIKKGKELEDIYDQVDIGAGCLGLHRCNSKDSGGLKTKEYIAKGLPFFYSGEPLFDKSKFSFGLQIEANENPVDIKSLLTFYHLLEKKEDIPIKMREWAKDYTWEAEMKKVFNDTTQE